MESSHAWLIFRSAKSCRRHSGTSFHAHLSSANPTVITALLPVADAQKSLQVPGKHNYKRGEIQRLWCQVYGCQSVCIHYMCESVCVRSFYYSQPAFPLCHPSPKLEKAPLGAARSTRDRLTELQRAMTRAMKA